MISFFSDLWDLFKKHPKLLIPTLLLVVAYLIADYCVFSLPSHVVREYYSQLSNGNSDTAWQLLTDRYREKNWNDAKDTFKRQYGSFNQPENSQITSERPKIQNFLDCILGGTRVYTHSYNVEERFTKADLLDPVNRENSKWVSIYHRRDFPRMMSDELNNDDGSPASLRIRRYFEEGVVVQKEGGEWKISSINRMKWGLEPAGRDY